MAMEFSNASQPPNVNSPSINPQLVPTSSKTSYGTNTANETHLPTVLSRMPWKREEKIHETSTTVYVHIKLQQMVKREVLHKTPT